MVSIHDHLHLLFHFRWLFLGWTQLRCEALEGDAGALIELLDVRGIEIAALASPLLIVASRTFQKSQSSMCLEGLTAGD